MVPALPGTRLMNLPLFSLFLAAFGIATSSFIVAGLLPEISADMGVTIPVAGLLVTVYSVGVALGGPAMSLLTSRFPRKPTILTLIAVFIVGQAFCALAPTYELLLGARLVISLTHGTFFGLAAIIAVSIVAPEKRAGAISLVFAGITVANIIGIPGGTAIGHAWGWRAAFWSVGGLAVVAFAAMAFLLPANSAPRPAGAGLAQQFRVLGRHQVYLTYAVIVILMLGVFVSFTYIAPLLINATHIPPDFVPWMLLIFGVGSTAGLFLGGRLGDRNPGATLLLGFSAQVVLYLLLPLMIESAWAVGVLLFLIGFAAFVVNAPLQNRVLKGAADAPDLASTLMSSMFNVGIASGATIGSVMLSQGATYAQLPWVGFALAIPATALVAVAVWLDSRPAKPVAS
jgi:MFS transporter, DHA1 family, inner membrane transport protein